jgi:SNF2 family DNA or RNA helicase
VILDNGESAEIPAMIAVITRLRQAACFPAGIEMKITQKMFDMDPRFPVGHVYFRAPLDTPSIKLDMAEDKLEREVKAGHRSVVFSQFKTALADLEKRLTKRGLRVARFDGDTKQNTRIDIKRDFLRSATGESPDNYKYDVVLVNYKTGGVGLNFTDATYMLCLDEEWNPGKNTQAWARICRIGQTEETRVDIMRIEKSIDMWMKTLNEMKQAIINGFEQVIDVLASLREYFARPIETVTEQKAIEVSPIEIDDDFMAMLNDL